MIYLDTYCNVSMILAFSRSAKSLYTKEKKKRNHWNVFAAFQKIKDDKIPESRGYLYCTRLVIVCLILDLFLVITFVFGNYGTVSIEELMYLGSN